MCGETTDTTTPTKIHNYSNYIHVHVTLHVHVHGLQQPATNVQSVDKTTDVRCTCKAVTTLLACQLPVVERVSLTP